MHSRGTSIRVPLLHSTILELLSQLQFFYFGHLTNFDFILDSAKHPERFIEERARDPYQNML